MKKVLLGAALLVLVAAIGYFLIYPYDYLVRFEAPAIAGTVNQSVKFWNNKRAPDGDPVVQEDLYHLEQTLQVGDSVHRYSWTIEPLTDSTSRVQVGIRDTEHSLANKWSVLFGNSTIERLARKYVGEFAEGLRQHTEEFEVEIVGEAELPGTFYAYVPLRTSQFGKAGGMMDNYLLLTDVLTGSGVTLNGPPMIVVEDWDRETDSVAYNFCFPIIRSTTLPESDAIRYKRIFPKKAIKAIYHGNYITSDRAWYALMDYADKKGLEVEPHPVEVFFNNPNMGGNALTWTAEVYLPLREEEPQAGP